MFTQFRKQRAYIACGAKHHAACYKYTVVDRFPTPGRAAAWLLAWRDHALHQDVTYSKEDHRTHEPIAGEVDRFFAELVEE